MFLFQKYSSEGASSKAYVRIFLGLSEILAYTDIAEDKKKEIKSWLYDLSKDLILAEKNALTGSTVTK